MSKIHDIFKIFKEKENLELFIESHLIEFKKVMAEQYHGVFIGNVKPTITVEFIENKTKEYLNIITQINNIKINELNPIYTKLKNENNNHKNEINRKNSFGKLKSYNYWAKLNWGKYKFSKIADVAEKEPDYLLYCIEQFEQFAVTPFIFLFKSVIIQPSYLKALEINLIKHLLIDQSKSLEADCEYSQNSYSDYDTFLDAFDGDIDAWRQYRDE